MLYLPVPSEEPARVRNLRSTEANQSFLLLERFFLLVVPPSYSKLYRHSLTYHSLDLRLCPQQAHGLYLGLLSPGVRGLQGL